MKGAGLGHWAWQGMNYLGDVQEVEVTKPEKQLGAWRRVGEGRLGLGQGFGAWRSVEKVLPGPRLGVYGAGS